MTFKDSLVKQLNSALAEMADDRLTTGGSPNPIAPRGDAPPSDVYDNQLGYQSPFHFLGARGLHRPMFHIPEVAITHTPVSSLISTAKGTNTQTAQIIGGVAGGVSAPASGWGPVPNLQVRVVANGPVNLSASLSVQSNVASDTAQFAFYRNAQLISQIFSHSLPSVNNTPTLVSLSISDSPVEFHGLLRGHVYALYWKAGTGVLSATGTQRSLYATNLYPS